MATATESRLLQEGDAPTSSDAAAVSSSLSTVHLYYNDTELFSNTARITAIREADTDNGEKRIVLVTDETVMHPQGGTI